MEYSLDYSAAPLVGLFVTLIGRLFAGTFAGLLA